MTAELHCPGGCPGGRFEALNAPLYVGRNARYLSHDSSHAAYRCVVCGSIAFDLAAVSRQMVRDEIGSLSVLTCPGCGMMMLPPADDPLATTVECPECTVQFTVEEGMPRLHRGGFELDANTEDAAG